MDPTFKRPYPCNKTGDVVQYVCSDDPCCTGFLKLKMDRNQRWYFLVVQGHSCEDGQLSNNKTFSNKTEVNQQTPIPVV